MCEKKEFIRKETKQNEQNKDDYIEIQVRIESVKIVLMLEWQQIWFFFFFDSIVLYAVMNCIELSFIINMA